MPDLHAATMTGAEHRAACEHIDNASAATLRRISDDADIGAGLRRRALDELAQRREDISRSTPEITACAQATYASLIGNGWTHPDALAAARRVRRTLAHT